MNKIYRLVFSRRLGRLVVAYEIAKSCGKGGGSGLAQAVVSLLVLTGTFTPDAYGYTTPVTSATGTGVLAAALKVFLLAVLRLVLGYLATVFRISVVAVLQVLLR